MRSLLKKIFGSSAVLPKQEAMLRDPVRCVELRKKGNALLAQGMLGEAGTAYRAAMLADPDDALSFVNLGFVLYEQGDFAQSKVVLLQALENDPDQSDAHFMLSNLALDQRDFVGATRHLREVLRVKPDFDVAVYLSSEGHCQKALERSQIILLIDPDHANAHYCLGFSSLQVADFEQGWREYQWRFKVNLRGELHKSFKQPLWLGSFSVAGKTVLLHCEQGYGDTLQFCRYAREVTALGARVILQVQQGLGSLLGSLDGVAVLIEEGEPIPPFDAHCPLMSLPLALGNQTQDAAFGKHSYLAAPVSRLSHWQQRVREIGLSSQLRVGIVWSGNPAHLGDRQRSIPLGIFLNALPAELRVVCLQPAVRPDDAVVMKSRNRLVFLGEELKDFSETASLVSCLDLVITVDTSVAHLAGALGKSVWVLLPFVPDWRWQLNRTDSPWYADVRLFRQHVPEDWSHPLQAVRKALTELIQSGQ